MKKKKETRLILREMTRGDIEAIANWRAMVKTWWIWIPILAVVIIFWALDVKTTGDTYGRIGCGILAVEAIALMLYATYEGRKFWNSIKDKDQPIKID